MKKSLKIIGITLLAALTLCGCSKTQRTSTDTSVSHSQSQEGAKSNAYINPDNYIDMSDVTVSDELIYMNVYPEYDFDGDTPVSPAREGASPDGEYMLYDDEGKLVFYRNADKVYSRSYNDENRLSELTLKQVARDVVGAYIGVESNGLIVDVGEEDTYVVTKRGTTISGTISFAANSENDGDIIRWLSVCYDDISPAPSEEDFKSRVDSYSEKICSGQNAQETSRYVRFIPTDGKNFALYTLGFTDADGKEWTENVGFAQ